MIMPITNRGKIPTFEEREIMRVKLSSANRETNPDRGVSIPSLERYK
jgi:hypothetical protein